MGKKENYTTRGGVQLTDAQVQAIRQFTGISSTWFTETMLNEEEICQLLAPFFKTKMHQDDYHQIPLYHLTREQKKYRLRDWIKCKPDVIGAIEGCVKEMVMCIIAGWIRFDEREIHKLRQWSRHCDCQKMLYAELLDWERDLKHDNRWLIMEDGGEKGRINCNTFFSQWRENIYNDVVSKLEMTQEDTDGIMQELRGRMEKDEKLLGGKVKVDATGKYKFITPEDQHLEFKKSVFDPYISKIKKKEERNYKIQVRKASRNLIEDVLSSVCAFLNTGGGEIYIGVDDDTGKIVGVSADRNSAEFTSKGKTDYFKFQDVYMQKIQKLLENNIVDFETGYTSDMKFHNYGKEIDIFAIKCKKIEKPGHEVLLQTKVIDDHGNELEGERKFYKRVNEHDEEVKGPRDVHKHLKIYFPWQLDSP